VSTALAPPTAGTPAAATRRRLLPLAIFAALALAPLVALALGQPFYVRLLTRVMILALAAMALDLVLGYGGMVSLGHAGFLGVGAYITGILAEHGVTSGWVQWPLAVLAAGLVAALIGALSLRTKGVYFIMVTLAFAQMLYYSATSLSRYGGDDGLTIWNRSDFGPWLRLADPLVFYFVVLAILGLAFLGLRRVVASRFGRVIQGSASNDRRMQALGFDTFRYRLVAFTLSGALTGLAGVLLANHTEFVAPAYMAWVRSGELVLMLVIGGPGTLHGAILGAVVFLLLEELLADLTTHWQVVMGPLVILIVLFARGGLVRLGRGPSRT